ncbi:ABC transporter permease [Desulfosarcina ovata]|uniref:Peptide ABC transporter permease n=2 Tax=Desulfosarcina ovata TaxID=83564 RepID=A0A5K8A646_9BACT|nr:ABC transporter permease [Desulfosarcina ovata]BBO80656.1 peptide ABC transporter permease [Desulfosarcina ovata subsp. sediminis]BBO87868.1 peptide ABC transporter permease [Desulfosarcina ovata subsp. ovata]
MNGVLTATRRIFRPNHSSNLLSDGGRIGMGLLALVILMALGAPWICRHSPRVPSGPALIAPCCSHPMGTDELGVDLLAQVCFGARISLLVGVGTALLAGLGGGLVGILAGYRGGWLDRVLMRLIDILLVLPDLPVMIVLAAFLGPRVETIIFVLAAFSWVFTARIVRSRVLSLKQRRYVHAAETYGAGVFYLMRRHFLPEIFPLAAVSMIRLAGRAIVAEAGLSFLGLGDPTSRSWGMIIHHALSFKGIYYTDFWKWWLVFPWLALMIVVTSLALVGRDLEKAADPRMEGH